MSSAHIDDIWDLPAETATRTTNSLTAPLFHNASEDEEGDVAPHKAKPPLFLPSDDEDGQPHSSRQAQVPVQQDEDIDALFEGLDDFQDLAPTLDLDKVRREADARHAKSARAKFALDIPSQTQSGASGSRNLKGGRRALDADSDGEKSDAEESGKSKKKKPRAKLDETRLLGDEGLPRLIKEVKDFKPLGKGYETKDLDRVMEIYQFWSHRMWPKDRFADTVQRVEKLCHSRRMHVALSVWHDEAKGLVNGRKLLDADVDVDLTSDEEAQATKPTGNSAGSSRGNSPAPLPKRKRAVVEIDEEDEGVSSGVDSYAATLPPLTPMASSGAEDNLDDMDLDAVLAHNARSSVADNYFEQRAPKPPASSTGDFDDDSMWDMFDSVDDRASKPPEKPPTTQDIDGDEDMWEAVREAERESMALPEPVTNKPLSARTLEARRREEEEEWESMYA